MVAMSDDSILAELERKALEAEAVAAKYRAAIAVLRGKTPRVLNTSGAKVALKPTSTIYEVKSRVTSGKKSGPTSTMSMIRTVLSGSSSPLSVTELTERMLIQGWDTQSENPSNTVRTAASRLVDKRQIERTDDGAYFMSVGSALVNALGINQDDDDDDDAPGH